MKDISHLPLIKKCMDKSAECEQAGDRSNLIHYLTDYIQLCQEIDRNFSDELEEVLYAAFKNHHLKVDKIVDAYCKG